MGEADDPPLFDRPREDRALRLERVEREEILRRDPRQREMVAVGHEVRREERGPFPIQDAHGLRAARVSLHPVEPDARQDLDGLVDELELPGRLERREVVGEVRGPRALVRLEGIDPLEALEHVARTRERGHNAVAIAPSVAARVVEVQMGVDDERDVVRPDPARRELVQQLWRPLDPVDVPLLVGELRARAGLDEHDVVGVADEHAVHVHRDPIEVVRLLLRVPEDLWNDAEHRAAVDLERAVAEDVDLETAEPHGGSMRKWTFGRTAMATAIASARSGSPAGSRSVPATTMHRSQSSPLATQG